MFIKVKYLSIFAVIAALLLVAAQCGAAPAAVEQSTTETESEVGQAENIRKEPPDALEMAVVDELAPVALAEGEKLKVVATTSILADVVKNVGGDLIELSLLLPIGTDPHTFEPMPRDLASVADAHLIFASGLGLEGFLDEMIENAGGEAAILFVSQGVETREFGAGDAHEHEHEAEEHEAEEDEHKAGNEQHEHEEEHHHLEGADPHTWTTPANAIVFVHNIEHALSALDPANAEAYAANADTYEAELAELDAWVKAQIESIPTENRELVTDHASFGYYADRYGLEQIGAVIPSFSTTAEPSAKELAKLEDAIKEYDVKAIFVSKTVNPALSERVAEDTGTRLLTLYAGSLGPEGSGVETYVDYIKYNTNTIVEGLR